jgi:GGDEF domain-containing protein
MDRALATLLSRRRLLFGAALVVYSAVFALFLFFERPGLGIAHGYYVAIVLAGVAGGPQAGVLGGLTATVLYAIGVVVNPHIPPTEIPTEATAIRLVTFVLVGTMIGYFAAASRTLLAGANELMAELTILAQRDFLTGLPNQRAFESTIGSWLASREPFILLIGETDALDRLRHGGNRRAREELLLDFAEKLRRAAGPAAEISRTGNEQFGVLASAQSAWGSAGDFSLALERALDGEGCRATFGWATFPLDGDNALALFTAASERMYARKVVRDDRPPADLLSGYGLPQRRAGV